MNCRKSIFKFLGIAAVCAASAACSVDDADDLALVKLGALKKEFVVEADANTFDIDIYANSAFHIERINQADWISLTCGETEDGKGAITAECEFNEGFKRKAGFVLCSDVDARRDTVYVKQKALVDAKGWDHTVLITDCLGCGGMPEGEYMSGGLPVVMKGGLCYLLNEDGTTGSIAGSVLTLAEGVSAGLPAKTEWVNYAPGIEHAANRIGSPAEATPEQVVIGSVREGMVPGIHTVTYESEDDILELKHTIKNRRTLAMGAVIAAEFLCGKQGVYSMDDLLK